MSHANSIEFKELQLKYEITLQISYSIQYGPKKLLISVTLVSLPQFTTASIFEGSRETPSLEYHIVQECYFVQPKLTLAKLGI